MREIDYLKKLFSGDSLRKILKSKNTNKWRIAKETGITYQTLCNWQSGRTQPKDEKVLFLAKYLGLIGDSPSLAEVENELSMTFQKIKEIKAGMAISAIGQITGGEKEKEHD